IGLYRQMPAEPSVYQGQQHDASRPAKGLDCRKRGPDTSSRIQYIVNEDHFFVLHQKIHFGRVGPQDFPPSKIVPEKCDVQKAKGYILYAVIRLEDIGEPIGQENSPGLNSHKGGFLEIQMVFQELACQPMEYDVDFL